MYVQEVLQTLNDFWRRQGCILWQPYHTEVGAGTSNPATFLRVLGPEPWWVAYPEPSARPADGRYGENPNRLQHYFQYQVILKPSPPNVQDLFLQSLEALGLDLTRHDFRFVEDNWQSPSLGAWGLGWEAWLDGMEILQFTYFQECGGVKLDVRACELTYGVERIAMYLQGVESVYDLKWAPSGITYGDIFHAQEVEYCRYNFEYADTAKLFGIFDLYEGEALRLMGEGLILPAYDHCLRLSHLFNLLDARGALSVTERNRFLLRSRTIAEGCARGFLAQRKEMGFPLLRLGRPGQAAPAKPLQIEDSSFSEKANLLLEIGVEELPHHDVEAAARQAQPLMERLLTECELPHGAIKVYITPRRIAFEVKDVPSRQMDVVKEARGPKKAAAVSPSGEWTVAAQRFAEANGAAVGDIFFGVQGNAEYCFVKAMQKGRKLRDMLSDLTARLLKGLQFGKSMGWEDSTVAFSRPVRWLLALHGGTPVPISWQIRAADHIGPEIILHSGQVTYGHRRLNPGAVTIYHVDEYLPKLREHFVEADRVLRLNMLCERVNAICKPLGLIPEQDEDLMAEIADLGEWPEPILCEIPAEALELPEAIVITPMKVHQRYIPLREPDGALSRHFLAVANGGHNADGQAVIREGNQRVLNARLRDAKYFWDTDTKHPLSHFAEGLSLVMFHQDLGVMADKVARIKALYTRLAPILPQVDTSHMNTVISLMKADLTTQMVGEFDSLEGLVGMLYARKEGLPEEIATAIFEHRLPRRAEDGLPEGQLGRIAGLLDRFDTLAGYFGIGIRPKGTSDPFGLRRNALAILSILEASGIDADLEAFLLAAVEGYGGLVADVELSVADALAFFLDRLGVMTREEGHPYDRVLATIQIHGRRPLRFKNCLSALEGLDPKEVQNLAEQTKRMQRIIKEPALAVTPGLLDSNEAPLFGLLGEPASRARALVEAGQFEAACAVTLEWLPVINGYFETTLVNDKDDNVRRNRHALLRDVLAATMIVADFTQIEKREIS